jgi:hypothetical protein
MADQTPAQTSAESPKPDAPGASAPAPLEEKEAGGETKADAAAEGETATKDDAAPGRYHLDHLHVSDESRSNATDHFLATTTESTEEPKTGEASTEAKADTGADDNDKPSATNGEAKSSETPAEASTATPSAANAKNKKRRSSAGIPEHKGKKLSKKKSMPNLNLDVQPGQYWMARMKGHPPWPAIACDEQMLPDTLLSKRPVSAVRPDGTYRDDFKDGGKNVRDRRYAVMFLGTNEL